MTTVETRAILSLLDVVEELANEVGEAAWSETVVRAFAHHRLELKTGEVEPYPDGEP